MQFDPPLLSGRLVKRYKRFLADIRLDSGEEITAHCPNPGSMRSCLHPGARVWVSDSQNPARKLQYTWELAAVPEGMAFVNPVRANRVVEEALSAGAIPELTGYASLRPEVRYGDKSRIDFLLEDGADGRSCYVEVKNLTLRLEEEGRTPAARRGAFPDSVTARGTKHVQELAKLLPAARAVMLFCVSRTDVVSAEPADAIDPVYGKALRAAVKAGVEVLAYQCAIDDNSVRLDKPVPVLL